MNQIENSNYFEILLEETKFPGPYLEIDTKKPPTDAILGLWTVVQIYLNDDRPVYRHSTLKNSYAKSNQDIWTKLSASLDLYMICQPWKFQLSNLTTACTLLNLPS